MNNRIDKKEEHAVLPDDLLRDIARLKGRPAPQQSVPVATSVLYPVTAAVAAEERRKEEAHRNAIEEALKNPARGQEIPGHGVFIGTWQPEGLSLKFNVFAAKQDLPNESGEKAVFKYVEAVQRIASLTSWHGHRGMNYETDRDLFNALKDGSYMREGSGWFIPPRELLIGTDRNERKDATSIRRGPVVQPDNLYDHSDRGILRGTFHKKSGIYKVDNVPVYPNHYWSSTECSNAPFMWIANFASNFEGFNDKGIHRSCRPVRLELAP